LAKRHLKIHHLGLQFYEATWQAMVRFTSERTEDTDDEIWILEHHPVYTLGMNGKPEHLLASSHIPLVKSDRGGQVTYHGPGQLIMYTLLDMKRHHLGVRQLVNMLEKAMINVLITYGIESCARPDAPGVYVEGKKIGSIGLRIKNNCCYHGLSLNNTLDLSPFNQINTCGYSGLQVTRLVDLGVVIDNTDLAMAVIQEFKKTLH
jgi:lipoyl(octanoyl) transferase